ncbi:hypothetical protein EVAR_67374_1 [Eumeta japonica]|uniref:PiggyBac transposable element-derived protein domain-containing protein n=1 Tax=Eumeta variegata TaxID=151549 RepID=A0A4C1ZQ86_EUMVA|nr:hypothetical protein EVAR_67374_1 [Eumeta japonica]
MDPVKKKYKQALKISEIADYLQDLEDCSEEDLNDIEVAILPPDEVDEVTDIEEDPDDDMGVIPVSDVAGQVEFSCTIDNVDEDHPTESKSRTRKTVLAGKKWYWPLVIRVLDMSLVNAWIIYNHVNKDETIPLLDFRRRVCFSWMKKSEGSTRKPTPGSSKLMRLKQEVKKKCPELINGKSVVFRYDNARLHISLATQQILREAWVGEVSAFII